ERIVRRRITHLRRSGVASEPGADQRRVRILVAETDGVPELVDHCVLGAAAADHDVDAAVALDLAARRLGFAYPLAAHARDDVDETLALHEVRDGRHALLRQALVVLVRA